jgi:hypothetical protein
MSVFPDQQHGCAAHLISVFTHACNEHYRNSFERKSRRAFEVTWVMISA